MTDAETKRTPLPPYLYRRPGVSTYSARVRVPSDVVGYASTHVTRSLRTDKLPEAKRRLPLVVAEILQEFEAARRVSGRIPAKAQDPMASIARDAEWWRRRIEAAGGDPRRGVPEHLEPEYEAVVEDLLGDPIGEEVAPDGTYEVLYEPQREARTLAFTGMVRGTVQPVDAELDRYLTERQHKSSYESRIRLAVRRLKAWLQERSGADNVATLSRRQVSLFVDHLTVGEITVDTVNSLVSALCAYWRWMERRGAVKDNPWKDQQRTKTDRGRNASKRPFTDEEVKALLAGDTYVTLHDLMRLALLTGMRLSELVRLRVADVGGGLFQVMDAKTKAGVRKVPIHPLLEPLVKRRTVGKAPETALFDELKPSPSRPERVGGKVTERFTAYRRSLGLDDRLEGRRQANADFHSFRRWAITKLEQSGGQPHIIAALVGHEEGRNFLALLTYSEGPSTPQLSDTISKLELPAGSLLESPGGPRMGDGKRSKSGTGDQHQPNGRVTTVGD